MEKKSYLCEDCGSVFDGKEIIVNLKERLGKGSFKSLLQNPLKSVSKIISGHRCPECGSANVVEEDGKVETEIPDYLSSGWDSSLLAEYFDPDVKSSDSTEEKSKVKDFIKKTTGYFNDKIDDFKEKYNPSDLMKKIGAVAKKAGASTVYHVLLLYYALTSSEVPTSKKIIVMAALGYFIAPVDFIPDFILAGLLDDGSILLFAINQILPYITDEIKEKALAKLKEWFGKSEIVSIKSKLLPEPNPKEARTIIEEVELDDNGDVIESEIVVDNESTDGGGRVASSNHNEKSKHQKQYNMEIFAPYKEINEYVADRFHQPITVSYISENEFKITYTKRVFVKVHVNINIKIEEVVSDSILLAYDGSIIGLDSVISGALTVITEKYPELSAGLHPIEGHQIRINLAEIEKAKAIVENVELRAIKACEEGLRIEFGLKVPSKLN